MKKLLIGMSLCAAMAAQAEISSDIVGYAETALQSGSKIVTPQFLGVATENGQIELQSIKCAEEDSDLVFISTLDSVGAVIKTYGWITYGGKNGDEWCWIDTDTMEKPEKPVYFDPGEGLWVEGDSEDNVITFPGVEL